MSVRAFNVAALVLSLFAAHVALAGNEAGPSPCAECHGAEGIAVKSGIPHLNGQLPGYLEDSIAQFRGGRRPGKAFGHDPAGIDAAQLQEELKRYSAAKAVRPRQEKVVPQLVTQGEAIYRSRCAECHPDNGRESDNSAPLMAAQDLDYMIKQMRHFTEGKRKFVFMMDKAFQGLTDSDLESVAHFFASQDQLAPLQPKKRRR